MWRRCPDEKDAEFIAASEDFRLANDLVNTFAGKTGLIFANNKQLLEAYADLTSDLLSDSGQPIHFVFITAHCQKAEREDTEEALRSSRPTTTFCSSTLELELMSAMSVQWDNWRSLSVSSLKQRLDAAVDMKVNRL